MKACSQSVWRKRHKRAEALKTGNPPIHSGSSPVACGGLFFGHKGPNIAGIDSKTKRITPLYNPRRHKWSRHFRWDGPRLVGLTPQGRATIIVLKINLDYRVDLRRGLIEEGLFPPTPE